MKKVTPEQKKEYDSRSLLRKLTSGVVEEKKQMKANAAKLRANMMDFLYANSEPIT